MVPTYMSPRVASCPSGVMSSTFSRMRNFISSAARSVNVNATISDFARPPMAICQATRRAMISVLPEPAPAMTSTERLVEETAARCASVRPARRESRSLSCALNFEPHPPPKRCQLEWSRPAATVTLRPLAELTSIDSDSHATRGAGSPVSVDLHPAAIASPRPSAMPS